MNIGTRKLMWSVPLIAAVAVIGALAMFMAQTPNQAAAQQQEVAPGMPRNLTATELDQTTIKLTWEKPADGSGGLLDGYRIDYSADNKVWYTRTADVAASKTEYVDNDNLKASQMRYYRIFAFNTGGSSPAHDPVSATTKASNKPDAPTALLIAPGTVVTGTGEHRDNEWLVLTWRAPVNPPGAPVMSYRVEVSKDGSSFTTLESELSAKDAMCTGASVECTYTHKGLFESTTRTYRVYAKNSVDESAASTRSSGKTNPGNIPAAAGDLRVSVTPAGGMALYWDRPGNVPADDTEVGSGLNDPMYDPNGAPILGYYVMGDKVDALGTPTFDGDDEDTLEDTTVSTNEVYYVEANTDLTLTSQVLSRLAKFDGTPNPAADSPTYWAFRVMAVNKVVQRKVADGTIDENDGTWSDGIAVNNAPNTNATTDENVLLGTPTITKVALHAASDQGRTGIDLGWEVVIPNTDPDVADVSERYRVEYSKDRIDWITLQEAVASDADMFGTFDGTSWAAVGVGGQAGVHRALTAGTPYHYRVFALQSDDKGTPGQILTRVSRLHSLTTSTPNRPEAPDWTTNPNPISETVLRMNFRVHGLDASDAVDPTVVAMTGSGRVGFGVLKGYRIEVSADSKDWTKYQPIMITLKGDPYSHKYSVKYDEATGKPTLTETRLDPLGTDVELTHTNLHQAAKRYYRVSTMNNAPGALGYSEPSAVMNSQTFAAQGADDPAWLVAKAQGRTAIQLLWTARADDITAANIKGYRIQSSPLNAEGMCAQDWTDLMKDTGSTDTSYTHDSLMPNTGYCYRVFGINVVGESTGFIGYGDAYVNTYDADAQATTEAAMVPGMPMSVMADATSDTAIKVTWESPADKGGADITGYVLERKSGDGDFMVIAATNAATWWNMLDCEAMNDAVPADSTPAPGADDSSSPYCKMYDGLSADAKKVVDATFTANYGTITGMMYSDMGLTPMTKYYYRVKAANSVGTGMPSDGMAYAMTDTSNTAPTEVGEIADVTVTAGQMSDAMNVSGYFNDADEGDTLSYSASSSNEAAATANIPDGSNMLTISGVAAGSATITVTATDAAGATASQTFMVTVTTAMPTRPTISKVSVLQNSIGVTWDPASIQGAEQIKVALFDLNDNGDIVRLALGYAGNVYTINPASAAAANGAHTFTNVPAGTYKVGVANFANGEHRTIVSSEQTVSAP